MEILNIIQGSPITEMTWAFWIMLTFVALSSIALLLALETSEIEFIAAFFIFLILYIISVLVFDAFMETGRYEPTQYEVIITDSNYTIDALEYRLIDVRGEVYVIEELKN